jgi:hypothetical protein
MNDKLENFIRNNKKQFDEFEVPEGLWDNIEQRLEEKATLQVRHIKGIKTAYILRIAASISIIVMIGIGYWQYQKNSAIDISSINPDLAKQELHYASLIQEKNQELQRIKAHDPALYNEFSSEIKTIDENYKKLKKELVSSPNQEETLKAMIRNLQIQIQVLNQQLQIIEQLKEFKNGKSNAI